ncbi:MAG: peptidylprolyl isomerase [Caulobacteraceae bacterium]
MKARLTAGKMERAAWVFAALLTVTACTHKAATEHPPQPGDKAVARVNGEMVWTSDVKREAVAQGLIGPGEPLDASSQSFRQVLDEVVDQKLLAAEALRRGLEKDPLAERRLAAARERVLDDILLETSVGKAVNNAAINGLYREMVKNETPAEEIHLRQIVLGSPVEAAQVRKLLAAGGSFEVLAAERSKDDATRFKGGEMAPTTLDMLPPAYAAALKSAQAGALVGPFQTDAGWVVARLDGRRQEPPLALDVARPQIIRFLTYDQVKDLILNLRRRAEVEVLIAPPAATPGNAAEPASAPAAAPASKP